MNTWACLPLVHKVIADTHCQLIEATKSYDLFSGTLTFKLGD